MQLHDKRQRYSISIAWYIYLILLTLKHGLYFYFFIFLLLGIFYRKKKQLSTIFLQQRIATVEQISCNFLIQAIFDRISDKVTDKTFDSTSRNKRKRNNKDDHERRSACLEHDDEKNENETQGKINRMELETKF